MIDVTEIIKALIIITCFIVTGCLIPYIRSETTTKQFESFLMWTQVAVEAAEQIFGSGKGKKKKAQVVEFLKAKGFSYDEDEVNTAIESAVLNLKMNGGEVK